MKYSISFLLIACSLHSQAQNLSQPDTLAIKKPAQPAINPVNTNVELGPGVTTTLNSQPAAIPTNNSNPRTGIVISRKPDKYEPKAVDPLGTPVMDSKPANAHSKSKAAKKKKAKNRN